MALVKVVGLSGNVQTIPRSMYESYFKGKGYMLLNDVMKKKVESGKDTEKEDDGEFTGGHDAGMGTMEEGEQDIESIPLSEMNGKQVKQFAELKGIDVSSANSTREAKDIVRNWMQENGL